MLAAAPSSVANLIRNCYTTRTVALTGETTVITVKMWGQHGWIDDSQFVITVSAPYAVTTGAESDQLVVYEINSRTMLPVGHGLGLYMGRLPGGLG
jgi:hypothetical protein